MIDRVEILVSRIRRAVSHTRWSARVLGQRLAPDHADEPGLVMIQIDGLGEGVLRRALREGRMPFLRKLIQRDGHRIHSLYSGLPSSTPAVQAELFYGVHAAVPAWRYRDPVLEKLLTMGEPDAAAAIEKRLAAEHEGLLAGGGSWSNLYCGGAAEAHLCIPNVRVTSAWRAMPPHRLFMLILLHWKSVFRVLESLITMTGVVLWDLVRFRLGWRLLVTQLRVLPMRVAVSAVLREIITVGASIHAERGLPIIHLNFLGYDEDAHIRGPHSRAARSSLRAIDSSIRRIAKAARRAHRRDYQLWIYSDHGQEHVIPFETRHGITVPEAVEGVYRRLVTEEEESVRVAAAVAASAPDAKRRRRSDGTRESVARTELTELRFRLLARPPAHAVAAKENGNASADGKMVVTHQGSIGMVYLPARHDRAFLEKLAGALVREAGIPLVATPAANGHEAVGFSASGRATLPGEAGVLFGQRHPHSEAVAEDLARLVRHPGAGDLIIAGWNPVQPLSLQIEKGSHGGPGPEETAAFVIFPPETLRGTPRDAVFRPAQLRDLALEVLGRKPRRANLRVVTGEASAARSRQVTIRLMTYNVHRCRGMDGKFTTRRIARVIDQSRPDIVCLQELDRHRVSSGRVDQAHSIAEHLETAFHFHRVSELDDGGFGNAVLSALPMRLISAGPLPAAPPYWKGLLRLPNRGALWVAVDIGGEEIQVITTHLSIWDGERRLQVGALLGPEWLGHPGAQGSVILAGDLNSMPGSAVLRRLRRRLRSVVEPYSDATLRTWSGRVPLYRIDHILVSEAVRVQGVHVPRTTLSRVASDHLPLVVDMAFDLPDGLGHPDTSRSALSVSHLSPHSR